MLDYTTTSTAYYTDKDSLSTTGQQQQHVPPPVPVHNFYHPLEFYENLDKGTADQRQMFHQRSNTEYDCAAVHSSSSSDESSDEGDTTDHQQQLLREEKTNSKSNKTITKEHSFWQVHSSTTIIAPPCAFEEANIVIDMPPLRSRKASPKKNDKAERKQESKPSLAPVKNTSFTPRALTPLPRLEPATTVSSTTKGTTTASVSKQQPLRQPIYLADQVRSILGSVIDEIDEAIDRDWNMSRELLQKSLNQPPPPAIY